MKRLLLLLFLIPALCLNAQVFEMYVSKTAPGAYRSIGSAIARVPTTPGNIVRIYIENGIYEEKIDIISSTKMICLIGESRDGVIITNDDNVNTGSASESYTVWADADDLYCENLTIVNSSGNVGQAIALKTDGERQVFKNCRLVGFQDTFYAHSNRQYLRYCIIEGATDFIYGDATTVMDSCTIKCLTGGSYITAPADSKLLSTRGDGTTMIHGLLFLGCSIIAAEGVSNNSYYLGRPWQPNASSVYKNCQLGDHISPLGWSTWDGNNHLSSYFAEYRNVDESGQLIDTTGRADWSYQLSDDYADSYYNLAYFLEKNGESWDPIPVTVALGPPAELSGNGFSLSWTEVPNALGYVISRNDSTIGFTESTTYTDEAPSFGTEKVYTVKSVSTYGALSKASNPYTIPLGVKGQEETATLSFYVKDKTLLANEDCELRIFNLSGKLVFKAGKKQVFQLPEDLTGIYLVSAIGKNGINKVQKIYIY